MKKAEKADKYELYELAAQHAEMTVRFLRAVHKGDPRLLGEDFSGTAAVSRAWVQQGEDYASIAVDHDEEPLRRAVAERVAIHRADVMAIDDPVDVIAALNFSVCECHDRQTLLNYLTHAHKRLSDRGGIVVLDLFGGSSTLVNTAIQVQLNDEVMYTWENEAIDVMTNQVGCRMSFQFDDGSEMAAAFLYHWRMWTPCEMIEAMIESGFERVEVYDRMGEAIDENGNIFVSPVGNLYATIEEPLPEDCEDDDDDDIGEEIGANEIESEVDQPWVGDYGLSEDELSGLPHQLPDWQCFVVGRTLKL